LEEYHQYNGIRINYSNKRIHQHELFLPASELLKIGPIQEIEYNTLKYNKIPALFKIDIPNSTLPFDLFATIFFHLSRYEEYLPFQADHHQRFTFKECWAYQNNCLHLPIVDQLVILVEQILKELYPQINTKKRSFCFQPTYDIDMAWAYKYKGIVRNSGGVLKDIFQGNKERLRERWEVFIHNKTDPFYTFDHFQQWDQKYSMPSLYFFLLGDYNKYDQNINANQTIFRQLIQNIATTNEIGIHPLCRTNRV